MESKEKNHKNQNQTKREISFENVHWADNSAQRTIDKFPNEKEYTVASGITPSGYIHIGNFRELITTEMVRRALTEKGKKVKFIYSWDSYDAFRKVPEDVPKEWEKYLRMPDGEVPNPFGEGSYAQEFMKTFENEISIFNFPIDFQNQYELQRSGIYANSIKKVLNNKHKVINALNKYRDEPLPDTWMPIDIYDNETKKDTNKIISYDGEYTLTYTNEKGTKKKINFKENPRVKLRWKADWSMRWDYYKVNFEPGGKDHSTAGSSYTTGCEIIRQIFEREPPVYTMYDFVRIKGQGGKISSSKGNALRVCDVLEVYTPQMVLYLFAGSRPNSEFDISFDLDVIKIYEDFDKLERIYYGLEKEKNPKKLATLKRVYELSMLNGDEIQKECPFQPSFRHLTTVAQANDFNIDKIKEHFKDELKTQFDNIRLEQRTQCAKNWLSDYAPDEMKFKIHQIVSEDFINNLKKNEKDAITRVKKELETTNDSAEMMLKFREITTTHNLETVHFFKIMYRLIIGKDKGPKLSTFIIENKEKVLNLMNQI